MRKFLFFSVCVIAVAILAAPASAGEQVEFAGKWIDEADLGYYESLFPTVVSSDLAEKDVSFGPNNWSSWTVGPSDAAVRDGEVSFNQQGNYLRAESNPGTASFTLPVHVPHGALIQYIYVWYSDTDPNSNPSMGFYSGSNSGGVNSILGMDPGGTWSGGATAASFGPISHTADYWTQHYYILALFSSTATGIETFYKAIVWYKLQVSPAPASATFNDVGTGHFFFREIEALADSGISGGCGSGNFCPDANVTRAQMAAFLSRALGLSYSADSTP